MNRMGLLGLMVGISILSGCTRVGPGYAGIKVSMAGSSRGVSDYPVTTGWVFYNPMGSDVVEYPTFVQTAVWTSSKTEGHPVDESITFTTKDKMQVHADISLSYAIEFDKVLAFYVKFRSDDLDKFTHGYLRNVARDIFDQVAGHFSIEDIMGDNAEFMNETRTKLQAELTPIGVVIQQLGFIGAPRPPQAVIDNINLTVQAKQIVLQKQAEVAQAQADAMKRIADAEGYAKSGLVQAEAQAKGNRMVNESLTPLLVQSKMLDKWNGTLPQYNGGSVQPFISLQKP